MRSSSGEPFEGGGHSPPGRRALLILAAAVFLPYAVALALRCVDAAVGSSSTFPNYENGWSVGSMVLMFAGYAIYRPGVLLGIAALILAQSRTARGRAAKTAWPLFMLSVAVIIVGVGRAICEVGSDYYAHMETLGWSTAQTAFGLLGRSLLQAGTLAGLAYLCGHQVGSATPCETSRLESKVDGSEA
jgi:hypothetical protein